MTYSEFVDVARNVGDEFLESLALADGQADFTCFGLDVKRISRHFFPMVKHALREGAARGSSTESLSETETFCDW